MRYLLTFLLLSIATLASAQISVGMRDNRFIYGAYTYKGHYVATLEQSVFSEKMGYQYMRGYAGYRGEAKIFNYSAVGYFGSTFNRSYWSAGAKANVNCLIKNLLILDGTLNPHYDSGDGYSTCWNAGGGFRLTRHIDLLAAYGNIPEYRMPEYRLKAGFKFHVGALSVAPRLSMMIRSGHRERSIRTLIDFNYNF